MGITSGTHSALLPNSAHSQSHHAGRRPLRAVNVGRRLVVALQYLVASACLLILMWIVMLMVYAPFTRMP